MPVQQQQQRHNIHAGRSPATAHAFRELYDAYHGRLLESLTSAVRNREMAEDIAATAFMRAFAKWDTFRGDSSFYNWVFAIARREMWRRNGRAAAVALDALGLPEIPVNDGTAESLDRAEQCRRLRGALRRIPPRYREILIHRFVDRQHMGWIADREGIPYGTALSRLLKAKRLLRAAWEV